MNAELHHRWNSERKPTRGSDEDAKIILKEQHDENKVTLKQVGPQQGKKF